MTDRNSGRISVFFILFCIFIVYSNSFYGDWVFDDPHNIIHRSEIHLEKLSFSNIANTFFREKNGDTRLYRPVSSLTFGLNWFLGEDNPRGYHVVNLIIHLVATVLVFKITKMLLGLIRYDGNIVFVAGIVAILWAIHPIQTQAVSNIVQRMASLAATFYLAGIYYYLHFKKDKKKKWLAASLTMFLFAVFSKENAALFPFTIIMIELLLADKLRFKKKHLLYGSIVTSIIIFSFFVLFRGDFFQILFEGYARRPFTLQERVFTESRIVLFHLYQLFMSPPESFGFNPPFVTSKNLFQPVNTFFSIIAIFSIIIVAGYCLVCKNKLIKLCGFSILFFFVHHLVESTILPLELYFEHRNYLPSVFVFIPVALLFGYFVEKYNSSIVKWVMVISLITAIIGMGLTTYNRNFVWQSRITFWKEAIDRNPDSFRPYHNLAYAYDPYAVDAVQKKLDKAISLYKTALEKNYTASNSKKRITLFNLGVIYSAKKDYEKAILYFKRHILYLQFKNIQISYKAYRKLSVALLKNGDFKEAMEYIETGIAQYPDRMDLYELKGFLLMLRGESENGLEYYRKSVILDKKVHSHFFRSYGVALSHSGYHERGLWYLKRYYKYNKDDIILLFFMANNLIFQNKLKEADFYLDQLFEKASATQIKQMVQKMYSDKDIYYLLLNKDMMREIVSSKLQSLSDTP